MRIKQLQYMNLNRYLRTISGKMSFNIIWMDDCIGMAFQWYFTELHEFFVLNYVES